MTRSEVTAFLAEKLSDALPEADRVLQCDPENGSFVYYDAVQTVYDPEAEAPEPELWLVCVFPAKAVA